MFGDDGLKLLSTPIAALSHHTMTPDTHQHVIPPSISSSPATSALISSWLHDYSEQNHIGPHNIPSTKNGKRRQAPKANQQAAAQQHFWQHDPQANLQTTSTCSAFTLGTGSTIFEQVICPLISRTTTELIFVTCFWAESPSLAFLGDALRGLAQKALQQQRQTSKTSQARERIRVRISFSSLSLFQKLFHTRSPHGHVYPPSTWVSKLGLPDPEKELLPGLDMTVTSFFWLPFSVMHPKFVVVDREVVALPSCNVSWEEWFEGCVVMTDGDADAKGEESNGVVEKFVKYASEGWDMDVDRWDGKRAKVEVDGLMNGSIDGVKDVMLDRANLSADDEDNNDDKIGSINKRLPLNVAIKLGCVPTVFLPSSHHINPRFRPFPWQKSYPSPPPTPLNTFLLTAFSSASASIYMQTPNLTCRPVLEYLLQALGRGVDVTVVTSEKLMVLEQLVTAGRTTKMCVRELVERYEKMRRKMSSGSATREERLEAGLVDGSGKTGTLRIMFFQPLVDPEALPSRTGSAYRQEPNPVQSHLKFTVIDNEITVLGSGNMDRASWYTSRELGIAYESREMSKRVMEMLFGSNNAGRREDGEGGVLKRRIKKYYDSQEMVAVEDDM